MSPVLLLSIVLQIACAVHAVRTGRPVYWVFILLIGSYIAVAIYFFAEILPGLGNDPKARRAVRGVRNKLDPQRGKREAAKRLDLSDTHANRQRLAEESLAAGDHENAVRLYQSALTGLYRTDPHLLLGLAQAQFALGQPQQARETLESLIAANPDFRSSDGHLLYARAVEATGDTAVALEEYATLAQGYPGEEGRVRFAQLLAREGNTEQARDVYLQVLKRADAAPAYYRREQREWIETAKRELQASARP